MPDIKILDEEIQKILVFEYFYLKKDPETISRIFDIPVLDLKYFFYSVEAHALFKKYENEFKDWPVPETLEQLRNLKDYVLLYYNNEVYKCLIEGESFEYSSEYSQVLLDDLYKGSISLEETIEEEDN